MSPVAKVLGDGWIAVASPEAEHRLSLHVEERQDGRLRIVELVLSDAEGLSGAMLRDLPLGAWEAQMNAPEMAALLRTRFTDQGPYGFEDLIWEHGSFDVTPMPRDADDGGLEFHFPGGDIAPAIATTVEPELNLGASTMPSGKRPDAFYRAVAEAYSWLAGHVRRPAVELAAINDVPPTTIHRWVKEARRRGLLGPGRRLVVYDAASPEVLGWAARVRAGTVSEWDLTHDPILRAWALRVRRGVVSWSETMLDPLLQAAWARRFDESLTPEQRWADPVVQLVADSPSPLRDIPGEDQPPRSDSDSSGDAP